jgi:hypothetical protein
MGNTIITSIVREIRKAIELVALIYIIDRIFKGIDTSIQMSSLKGAI